MNTLQKLDVLGAAAKYDACAASTKDRCGNTQRGICHASLPDGRCVSLLKVLYTNACKHDCRYCANPVCKTKATFEPGELAELTFQLYTRNYVEGLFLSSGVGGDEDKITEGMIECVRLLREKYRFEGYVHMKLLPGTSRDYVKRLCALADRVSINIESPDSSHFSELTSTKEYKTDVIRRLRWLTDERPAAGATTQFVVGAAGESDLDILSTVNKLYGKLSLRRSYYSAFSPVSGTELEGGKKTPLAREHRLYQADWLMRVYDFSFFEVRDTLDEHGFLSLSSDPKFMLASKLEPVDANTAGYKRLIRVPGVGPRLARRIISARLHHSLDGFRALRKLGVSRKAEHFLAFRHRQVKLDTG